MADNAVYKADCLRTNGRVGATFQVGDNPTENFTTGTSGTATIAGC
jgi:hypothetical protein